MLCGAGLGLLVSQINNHTLAPISEQRVGEAAGANSAISSFGLSAGLAFTGATLLAAMAFCFSAKSDASTVLAPAEKDRVAEVLEHDAQVMSDAQLQEQIATQPPATREETRPRSSRHSADAAGAGVTEGPPRSFPARLPVGAGMTRSR